MGSQTFSAFISEVTRRTFGRASILEVQKTINDSIDYITNDTNWSFLLTTTNINTNPIYNTGTISGTDGTNTITLTGGTWDTTWTHKSIYFGIGTNVGYDILSFPTSTSAIVKTNLNLGQNLVNAGYTIYQDTYETPADFSFGRELMLVNMQYRKKLYKPPRYTAENTTIFSRFIFNSYQWMYSDGGFDDVSKRYLVKLYPIPSVQQVYPMLYYRQVPRLLNDADTTVFPREFDEVITYLSVYQIKFAYGMPGWMEAKQEGLSRIKSMRTAQNSTESYDLYVASRGWPFATGYDSIIDGYAVIGPSPGTGAM